MIECRKCGTQFHPSHRACPQCQERVDTTARLGYLESWAEDAFDAGQSPMEIEAALLEEGLPSHLAHDLVGRRIASIRGEVRALGLKQLFGGGTMLLASAAIIALFAIIVLSSRGLTARESSIVAAAIITALYGLRLFSLGTRNLVTGRD